MTIRFACRNPRCGKPVRAPDESTGKKARCPHCQMVQAVPEQSQGDIPLADDQPQTAGFPELGSSEARPAAAAPRPVQRFAPRQMDSAPPKLIVQRSKRPYIVAGIALAALIVVGIAIVMILKNTSGKGDAGKDETATSPTPSPTAIAATATPTPAVTPLPTVTPGASPSPTAGIGVTPPPTPTAAATPTPVATTAPAPLPTTALPTRGPTISPSNPLAYVQVVVSAIEFTKIQVSRDNLLNMKKSIDVTAIGEDRFPASADELSPPASPGDAKKKLVYITGQSPKSPATNILMYDPHPYGSPSVKMIVLLVDGTVRDMHIDDLKKQLAAQKAKADEIPK